MPLLTPYTIQPACRYNAWPMIRKVGTRLICIYSRGLRHTIDESDRAVFARVSDDLGRTWGAEISVCDSPDFGEVPAGKGGDAAGAALFWVRRCRSLHTGWELHHDLYRSTDGLTFEKIAAPELDPEPIQITDIFDLPEQGGLMSLWFAGNYRGQDCNSWGTLTSRDNGRTWQQHVVENHLPKDQWPTEMSVVPLGNGHLLGIARRERGPGIQAQFQLESFDSGRTWHKSVTNIKDILESTPSLLLLEDGRIAQYYYQRDAGLLKRRTAFPAEVAGHPEFWPEPEILAAGSRDSCHAGNVNAVDIAGIHAIAYYTGTPQDTAVMLLQAAIPQGGKCLKEQI